MANSNHGPRVVRSIYFFALIVVITTGVLSRAFQTGNLAFDKYLGDSLYAVMIYLLLRISNPSTKPIAHFWAACIIVGAIETFQLTGIPLSMRESENAIAKLISIALGTKFGIWDLFAYLVGLIGIHLGDRRIGKPPAPDAFTSAKQAER